MLTWHVGNAGPVAEPYGGANTRRLRQQVPHLTIGVPSWGLEKGSPGMSATPVQWLSHTVAPTRAASASRNQAVSTRKVGHPPMALMYTLMTSHFTWPAFAHTTY